MVPRCGKVDRRSIAAAKPRRAMDTVVAYKEIAEFDPSEWAGAVVAFDEEEEEVWYNPASSVDVSVRDEEVSSEIPSWLANALEVEDIGGILKRLSLREGEVLRYRFLEASDETQSQKTQLQVANRMDISLARVSQLETQARIKLEKLALVTSGVTKKCRRRRLIVRRQLPQAKKPSERQRRWYEKTYSFASDQVTRSRPEALEVLFLRQLVNSVGYFYFKDDLCLEDTVLARIAARHGRVLAQRRETLRTKANALSVLLHIDDEEHLRALVSAQPALLGYATHTLTTKFNYLRKAYPYANTSQAVLAAPSLLTASIHDALTPTREALLRFLDTDTRLTPRAKEKQLSRFFAAAPGLARQCRIKDTIKLLSAHIDRSEDSSMHYTLSAVQRVPALLTLSATNIISRFECLQKFCGSQDAAAKAVRRWPQVLTLSETKLIDMANHLSRWLDSDDINALCTQCPAVLARSELHLNAVFIFLSEDLQLGPSRTASVVRRRPQALSLSLDKNLIPITNWLRSALFLDTPSQLARFIHSYPTVLGLSPTKNLGPKLDLLKSYARRDPFVLGIIAGHQSDDDYDQALSRTVARLVLDCPALLGYSQSKRIQPRLEALLTTRGLSFFAVSSYLTLTDATFRSKLAALDDNRQHHQQKKLIDPYSKLK